MDGISLYDDCVMLAYNKEVRRNCLPFTCGENDLDDFFLNDADLYADELLGKTYCWVTTEIPHRIVALFTLSNDSIKTRLISPNDKNRLQRNIVNPKRGRSYPAVLIGRLGVNLEYQGTSSHVGRQLMAFIKDWFRHRMIYHRMIAAKLLILKKINRGMHTMRKRFSGIMKETVSFHSIKQT